MRRALFALSLLATLIGCKGNGGPLQVFPSLTVSLAVDSGSPISLLDLLDGGIDFGTVPVLVPSDRTLLIGNNGGADLTVTSVTLDPDGGVFAFLADLPTTVPAGTDAPVPIRFIAPEEQTYQGTVTLVTDDRTNPMLTIDLIGRGSTQGKLVVTPDPIDFGAVGEGTSQLETVTLSSIGTAPLSVQSITLAPGTDPAFSIVSAVPNPDAGPTPPIPNTPPNNSWQIALQFSPVAGTPTFPDGGFLLIQSSDPNQQPYYRVPLVAEMVGAPVPLIQDPGTVPVGALVTLDGGASYDPGGLYPLSYAWSLDRKPGGSLAQLSDPTVPFPQMEADRPGLYYVSLNVTNDAGVQSLAAAHATITARPAQDIYVELVWAPHGDPNTQSLIDLDLSFLAEGGWLKGPLDCFWGNQNPGSDGGTFQAVCSSDQIVGPGPEWAGYANPADGTYTIAVTYYATHGQTMVDTDATVRIYIYGILEAQLTQTLSTVGETWWASTVTWPWLADGGINAIGVVNDAGTPP